MKVACIDKKAAELCSLQRLKTFQYMNWHPIFEFGQKQRECPPSPDPPKAFCGLAMATAEKNHLCVFQWSKNATESQQRDKKI